jgi:hypothetical protein
MQVQLGFFRGFTWIATKVADGIAAGAGFLLGEAATAKVKPLGGWMAKMNQQANDFDAKLTLVETKMDQQAAAAAMRAVGISADTQRLQATAGLGESAKADLEKGDQGLTNMKQTNDSRIAQTGRIQDTAERHESAVRTKADGEQARDDELSSRLEQWAATHQASRQQAAQKVASQLEGKPNAKVLEVLT